MSYVQTHIDRLRLVINRGLKVLRLIAIHKFGLDTQSWEHDLELVVGASIQVGCRDNIITSMCERSDGNELRSLARRGCKSSYATLQRSNSGFEDAHCWVADTAVNVSELFETKKSCSVSGVIECEGL